MPARLIWVFCVLFTQLLVLGSPAAHSAAPASMKKSLHELEGQWARATYLVRDEEKQRNWMGVLAKMAHAIAAHYPDRAEPVVWEGVIASSQAKYAGVFNALGFAKAARKLFEKAGRIDYRALHGAVPTSLGALYYKVPGFPISFGDNDRARQYLEQGVQMSPDGLDSNFFYGDFLYRQGEYQKAVKALKHALAASHDSNRPVWDAGRRREISSLLKKIDEKMNVSE